MDGRYGSAEIEELAAGVLQGYSRALNLRWGRPAGVALHGYGAANCNAEGRATEPCSSRGLHPGIGRGTASFARPLIAGGTEAGRAGSPASTSETLGGPSSSWRWTPKSPVSSIRCAFVNGGGTVAAGARSAVSANPVIPAPASHPARLHCPLAGQTVRFRSWRCPTGLEAALEPKCSLHTSCRG